MAFDRVGLDDDDTVDHACGHADAPGPSLEVSCDLGGVFRHPPGTTTAVSGGFIRVFLPSLTLTRKPSWEDMPTKLRRVQRSRVKRDERDFTFRRRFSRLMIWILRRLF